ncbi:MAG: helix-turn-helix transcriptional regulator [Oscillospiraceae bacterium]
MAKLVRIKLEQYLAEQGITRYEVAKRTGIKYQTIDNYYKNRVVRFDGYILARICESLHCDISDLLECVEE